MRPQSLPLRYKSGRRKQPRGEMNFMNEMENQENKILEEQESQAYEPVEFEEGTMDASVEGEYRADEIQVLEGLEARCV